MNTAVRKARLKKAGRPPFGIDTPLRKARLKTRKTLAEIAELAGTDVGNLSRIESGKQRPRPKLAERLSELLRIGELKIIYPERFPIDEPLSKSQIKRLAVQQSKPRRRKRTEASA